MPLCSTKMWQTSPTEILFSASVKETGAECLSGGWMEMRSEVSKL